MLHGIFPMYMYITHCVHMIEYVIRELELQRIPVFHVCSPVYVSRPQEARCGVSVDGSPSESHRYSLQPKRAVCAASGTCLCARLWNRGNAWRGRQSHRGRSYISLLLCTRGSFCRFGTVVQNVLCPGKSGQLCTEFVKFFIAATCTVLAVWQLQWVVYHWQKWSTEWASDSSTPII